VVGGEGKATLRAETLTDDMQYHGVKCRTGARSPGTESRIGDALTCSRPFLGYPFVNISG